MKKEKIIIFLTIIAIIPSTLFFGMSILGIINILSNFYPKDITILISMLFGICGYIGLLLNLKQIKSKKSEVINFVFLILGVIGFIIFNSSIGGMNSWKWILTFEEPDEWLIFVTPILITIILIVIKGRILISKKQE